MAGEVLMLTGLKALRAMVPDLDLDRDGRRPRATRCRCHSSQAQPHSSVALLIASQTPAFVPPSPLPPPTSYCLTRDTMPAKSQGQTLLEKADKKANSSTGWFSSASTKYEEAGDLYQQAANAFKIDKLFREAGDAHAREAECREKCQESNEAAQAWWNAAKAYKRGFPDCECIYALQRYLSDAYPCNASQWRFKHYRRPSHI